MVTRTGFVAVRMAAEGRGLGVDVAVIVPMTTAPGMQRCRLGVFDCGRRADLNVLGAGRAELQREQGGACREDGTEPRHWVQASQVSVSESIPQAGDEVLWARPMAATRSSG